MKRNYYVGLDLGQKGDYTAIAVVEEWVQAVGGVDPVTFDARKERRLDVRYLERVPLGDFVYGDCGASLRIGAVSGVEVEVRAAGGRNVCGPHLRRCQEFCVQEFPQISGPSQPSSSSNC
jgi:hypothetical protein